MPWQPFVTRLPSNQISLMLYINLGTVVLAQGQPEQAVTLFQLAIQINSGNAMAHGNLGKALQDLGRIKEAISAYQAGILLQPDNAVIHANLGAALLESEAWDDAVTVTKRAISLQPDNAMAHANLGTVLLKLGRYDEAEAACRRAIALEPQGVEIHASLGGAMLELGALQEAEVLCRQAIRVDPTQPNAHFNLSHALKGMNQLAEAEFAIRQAIAFRPQSAEYHFHLAHILLLRGDLEAGWPEYDWRLKLPDFTWIGDLFARSCQPVWTGEDISAKTILIFTEQGLGDIIQFARYLPLVVRKAARVVVAAHPPMCRLLETVDGITVVPLHMAPSQNFDVRCPLLSPATSVRNPARYYPRVHTISARRPVSAGQLGQKNWRGRQAARRHRLGGEPSDQARPLPLAWPN